MNRTAPSATQRLASKDGERVRPLSRAGLNHTTRFPDVAQAVGALPFRSPVLDGEIAILTSGSARGSIGCAAHQTRSPRRRSSLEDALVRAGRLLLPVRRLADKGLDAWAQVLGRGYEGLVAKVALRLAARRRQRLSVSFRGSA